MFSHKLKTLREKSGLTQKELSLKLGFKSPNVYGMYEREEREPNFDTLKKISSYFGVTIDYLISDESSIAEKIVEKRFSKEFEAMQEAFDKMSPKMQKKMIKMFNTFIEEDEED